MIKVAYLTGAKSGNPNDREAFFSRDKAIIISKNNPQALNLLKD